jgi:hypothetical protein
VSKPTGDNARKGPVKKRSKLKANPAQTVRMGIKSIGEAWDAALIQRLLAGASSPLVLYA